MKTKLPKTKTRTKAGHSAPGKHQRQLPAHCGFYSKTIKKADYAFYSLTAPVFLLILASMSLQLPMSTGAD